MKRIILGVLRLILAALALQANYKTLRNLEIVEHLHSMRGGQIAGFIIALILTLNLIVYMVINAFMDFKNKPIKFKSTYVIFFIVVIIGIASIFPLQQVSLATTVFMIVTQTLSIFFVVYDFVQLWFNKAQR